MVSAFLTINMIVSYSVSFGKSGFDYVNPYIGTAGNGYGTGGLPLGAQVPFGSVRLGADTCQYDEECMTKYEYLVFIIMIVPIVIEL